MPRSRTIRRNRTRRPSSTKPSWKYILRKTMREFSDDQCTDLAAALTYYAVLALFPALLAMVSLLGLFGQEGKTEELVDVLSDVGAGVGRGHHPGPLQPTDPERRRPGLGLVIGVVGALWSASGYVGRVRTGDEPDLRDPRRPPVLEAAPADDGHHPGGRRAGRTRGDRARRVRAGRPGDRRRHRSRRDRGHRLEHRSSGRCCSASPRWSSRSCITRRRT